MTKKPYLEASGRPISEKKIEKCEAKTALKSIFIGTKLILDDSAHIPTTGMLILDEKNLKAHPSR